MGKTFIVDSLEDMCRLMCDNDFSGLEEDEEEEEGDKADSEVHNEISD